MREIKFRAWDKARGVMLSTDTDNFGDGCTEWYGNEEYLMLSGIEDMAKMEQYGLMQYTGLKDKNGKEIYEGDIVSSEQWNPKTYQVVFEDGEFGFKNSGDFYLNALHYLEKFEVIGNIYENPELLEAK
jgi:uncharacterized phage protein (TIGR01671 family)